jgi:hypothetical protein
MFLSQEAAEAIRTSTENSAGLTTAGWIFVTIAWTTIIGVAVFCYSKVLQKAAARRLALHEEVKHEEIHK